MKAIASMPSLALAAALAACGPGEQASPREGEAALACAPQPELSPSQDFADPRDEYGTDSASYKQLEANFAAAYRRACAEGLLAETPLVPADVPHPGVLFLTGRPEANVASIYREGDAGYQPGDMTLEYFFITAGGELHVPSEEELHEAIYCAVRGASDLEQAESGRCLPD